MARLATRLLSFVFIFSLPSFALTRAVIFPLVNKSGDKIIEWVSAVVPESFSRQLRSMPQFQVLEPTFLFGVDSMGWTMESDSLLKIHRNKWGWDIACGGRYSYCYGTFDIELRLIYVKNGKVVKKKIDAKCGTDTILALCSDVYAKVMSALGYELNRTPGNWMILSLTRNEKAYATYAAGYGYEMRHDYAGAITAYKRALEIDPSFSLMPCRAGKLYSAGNVLDSARIYFERCISMSPSDPDIVAEISDFLTEHELPAKAIAFVKANERLLNRTSTGMKVIGKSLFLQGELPRAVAMFNRAIAMGAVDLETDFAIGRAYMSSGDFVKASDVFNRLVKFRPDCMRYYALLGSAYRSSGRLMESARVLENAIKMQPDDITVCINLAQTYFAIGWYNDALQLLLRVQEKEPEIPEIRVNLGVVYWHMGRHREADSLLKQVESIQGMTQSVLNNEANALFLNGNIKKAIKRYRKANKTGKKNEMVLMNLGKAYYTLNKLNDASQFFDEVLRMSPDKLDVLTIQADIAEKKKKDADAERYYRKILDLYPYNEIAIERLVEILKKQKRFKEALEPLETYLNDYPNNIHILLMLADLYNAMEWYEVAIMKYQNIIRDFPDSWKGYLGLGKSMYNAIRYKNSKEYDKAIYFLKIAGEKRNNDPEPDLIIGNLYMDYKKYRELAVDHWQKALTKTHDKSLRKTINDLIAKAKQ